MVKHFNIIMAAVISGTVALFTSVLGISGTVIGSVLSSFLYQLLSAYSEKTYEEGNITKPNIAAEIVFIFPLVIIGCLELIFLLSSLHYNFEVLFNMIESLVYDNLFRFMGIGLVLLGSYPLLNSSKIKKINGKILIVVGVLLFLRGMMDVSSLTSKLFYMVFYRFDSLFAVLVILAILFVIVNVLRGSTSKYNESQFSGDGFGYLNDDENNVHARKIDTRFGLDDYTLKDRHFDSYYGENSSKKSDRINNEGHGSMYGEKPINKKIKHKYFNNNRSDDFDYSSRDYK